MEENWFPAKQSIRWGIGSRLQTWMARIFGKRIEATDGLHTVIGYEWRGRIYIVAEKTRS